MVPRKDSESSSSASEASDHAEESLSSDLVVTKYGVAADIANAVLKEVISNVKAGVEIGTLCDLGDKLILEKTSKIFKKEKDVQKGIAMPTCVSVDNTICHFSPLRSEPPVVLVDGQIVKVDLGAHVDGYIATVAHTVVVGASKDNKVTGAKANVIKAAYDAMEIAIRMLKPEAKHRNMDITDAIDKIAAAYGVKPIENMLSHELKRNKIDGEKQIIQNPGEKHRQEMEKVTFERFEAYAIDILFSTGEGKAKEKDTRTTVFKKADEVVYQLKMKASRIFLHEALNKHGVMPFTLRSFEDEVKAKLGVVECEKHGLMKPYQVLYDKDGDFVAQFKATVLIMPNGLLKITGLPLDTDALETTAKLEDATLVATLNQSLKPKNKKKKPATKKDGAEGGEGKDETAEEKKEPKEASKKEKKAKA